LESVFATDTVALFIPMLVGLKVMVKLAAPEGATVEVDGALALNIAASDPLMATLGLPVRDRSPVPRFSTVKLTAVLDVPTSTIPNPKVPLPETIGVVPCFRLISGAVPVPVRLNMYGFSSVSLWAIETVAVFDPTLVGVKVIVKVVEEEGATGDEGGASTPNMRGSVPLIVTIGTPSMMRSAVPWFSTVKLTAELELPTRTVPNGWV
jgi:hypothetical protein